MSEREGEVKTALSGTVGGGGTVVAGQSWENLPLPVKDYRVCVCAHLDEAHGLKGLM